MNYTETRRATTRGSLAWLIPVVGSVLAGGVVAGLDDSLSDARLVGISGILGLASGVLWQRVRRRDLADRLTVIAAFIVLGVLFSLLPGAVVGTGVETMLHIEFWLGTLAGLVFAERWLRSREIPGQ